MMEFTAMLEEAADIMLLFESFLNHLMNEDFPRSNFPGDGAKVWVKFPELNP
jgi:hypothetical protein